MTAWKPIDTAPKDGTHVLIWNDEGVDIGWFSEAVPNHDAGWWGQSWAMPGNSAPGQFNYAAQGQPTHWMPLPNPPGAA